MPVLTIASSKGGPGKTTLCQALATVLAGELRLVVLDADPTQAVSRWPANAYEGVAFETHAEADKTKLAHLIAAKADEADVVLVDTAGFGNRAATVAMTSADAVLVPSLAGEADITEAEKTVRLVEGFGPGGSTRAPRPGSAEPSEEDRPRPARRDRAQECGCKAAASGVLRFSCFR